MSLWMGETLAHRCLELGMVGGMAKAGRVCSLQDEVWVFALLLSCIPDERDLW
jgi:hypothetical protein